MCCNCQQKTLNRWGWILCLVYIVFAAVAIILAGVDFNLTATDWNPGLWRTLAGLEIASIVYVFGTFAFGMLTFCCCYKTCCYFIFIILLMLSLLFTCAIAIFGLVSGSIDRLNGYLGCQAQYQGVLNLWRGVDNYLTEVDSTFCSPNCPCKFDNTTPYTTNVTIAPYYNQWTKGGNAVAFPNCSDIVRNETMTRYKSNPNNTNYAIDPVLFADYWAMIENKFNCSGWCNTTYTNPYTNQPSVMWKYMFTDVNRGPSVYLGCLNNVSTWLPPILASFGAVALVCAILEAIVWLIALSACCCPAPEAAAK